jgi:hypothetical protein
MPRLRDGMAESDQATRDPDHAWLTQLPVSPTGTVS